MAGRNGIGPGARRTMSGCWQGLAGAARHVISPNLNPRFPSYMTSLHVASIVCQAHRPSPATSSTRNLNPRFVSTVASFNARVMSARPSTVKQAGEQWPELAAGAAAA